MAGKHSSVYGYSRLQNGITCVRYSSIFHELNVYFPFHALSTEVCSPGIGGQKFLALVAGCLAQLYTGSIYGFPLYMNSLKLKYGYSQHEIELLSIVLILSTDFGMPAAAILERSGPKLAFLVGLLLTTSGFLGAWLLQFVTQAGPQIIKAAMLIAFLCAGNGVCFTSIVSITLNCHNFEERHHGKVISLLQTVFGLGPPVMMLIYVQFFIRGEFEEYRHHDVSGFMCFNAILAVIVNVLCILLINAKPEQDVEGTPLIGSKGSTHGKAEESIETAQIGKSSDPEVNKDNGHCSCLSRILSAIKARVTQLMTVDAVLLLFVFCIAIGISTGVEINLSVYSQTLRFDANFAFIFLLYNGTLVVFRLLVGFLSDAARAYINRLVYLLLACALSQISCCLCHFFGSPYPLFITFISAAAVLNGVCVPVVTVVILSWFGKSHFAMVWSVFSFATGVIVTILGANICNILPIFYIG